LQLRFIGGALATLGIIVVGCGAINGGNAGEQREGSGPREAVIGNIVSYLSTVLLLSESAVESMRELNAPPLSLSR
jgi:hypothetical protein